VARGAVLFDRRGGEEGVAGVRVSYAPFSGEMFVRAWPQYRAVMDNVWALYVDGKVGLDEAIARTVGELTLKN
jgi:hypothetical protein